MQNVWMEEETATFSSFKRVSKKKEFSAVLDLKQQRIAAVYQEPQVGKRERGLPRAVANIALKWKTLSN